MTKVRNPINTTMAIAVNTRMTPRSGSGRSWRSIFRSLLPDRGTRCVDDAAAALELLADVVAARQESAWRGRERRHLVGIERTHEPWRDDDDELGSFLP